MANIRVNEVYCTSIQLDDNGNCVEINFKVLSELINSNKLLQEKVAEQDKEIRDITKTLNELYYSPGMPGYIEASSHFKSLSDV